MTRALPLPARVQEDEFCRLVEVARDGPWAADEVARLAEHLAASGERVGWSESWTTADVASTGGPASLSTLLAPLWLRTSGCHVVKLAIPGRPAGAIDCLGTIRGYRVQLSTEEMRAVVSACGYVHFLADERFAPLDAALYEYRRRNGAVAIPTLAAASLLSKKVAVGIRRVGLDVRGGPHGNFGLSRAAARANAALFCAAARLLGIESVAFLGVENGPAQPWIGRGESLVAMAHALGIRRTSDQDSWLDSHAADCWRMANTVAGATTAIDAQHGPSSSELGLARKAFAVHLEAQGATMAGFLDRVEDVSAATRVTLHAEATGMLQLDLARLREALVAAQADSVQGVYRDPAGIILLARPGAIIKAGEPIAAVRSSSGANVSELVARVRRAFRTQQVDHCAVSSTTKFSRTMEVIRA